MVKVSFKYKLYFTFLLYGFSLALFTQFIVFKINETNIQKVSIDRASEVFVSREKLFESYIKDVNMKLETLERSELFRSYLSNPKEITLVQNLFSDIAGTADNIMQLRYIDMNGQEIIRVDRDETGVKPHLIALESLQNKKHRYYFTEIIKQPKDKIWYSKIDLNMERGVIERPIKPVIRMGISLFHEGEKKGILIINILMKSFLQELTKSPLYDMYIVDKDGYVLVDSFHENCWSKYLIEREKISHFFPEEAKSILLHEEYIGESFYSKKIFLDNGEDIRLLIVPKNITIDNEIRKNIEQLLWILLAIVLVSFPVAYLFSRMPAKLNERIDQQKQEQDVLLSLFDLGEAVLFKWHNDEHWSIESVSKSVAKLLGYEQKDFMNTQVVYSNLIHKDDLDRVTEEVQTAIRNELYYFEHEPYRVITKDGTIKWILDSTVIVRDTHNEIVNFVGYLVDITEIKESELKLEKISRTDQLTQISNRMHLDDILLKQYARFQRNSEELSVILLDIDNFKSVNDNYGHHVGDTVLVKFAKIIENSLRKGDSFGRWGGEEFMIVLPYTDLKRALYIAEKVRNIVQVEHFEVVDQKTASFGVAELRDEMSIEELVDMADKALYKAKESGKNCVKTIQT